MPDGGRMFIFILSVFYFLCIPALAESKDITLYVDITEVHAPDGTKGTSMPLNILVAEEAQRTGNLEHRFHRILAPENYEGIITVYDWTNISHKPGFFKCDYTDAIVCGKKNNLLGLKSFDQSQKPQDMRTRTKKKKCNCTASPHP